MDKLAKHSWPSTDTLVIIVSLTVYRCRDLDDALTLPEVRQRTSHQASPAPRWCRDVGVRRPL